MHKYLSIFTIAYKNHHVYLADILGMNVIFVLRILVIITLYRAVFELSGGSGNVGGYSIEQLSWALIVTQVLVTSKPKTGTDISTEIKTGKIVTYLLNPVPYVWFKFFQGFSQFLGNILPGLVVGVTIGILVLGVPSTSVAGIFGSVVLIFGGMFVTFFGYMFIGLCAFFMEDSEALRWIYSKFDMIFGGNILPIPFLPPFLQTFAFFSPFSAAGYTAGLVFVGFNAEKFSLYLTIQVFWIIVYILACLGLYEFARKKLVVNGG
ncbi:MAG: ABC-2 family transporter protein [Candidatus Gracilibacteria bacterium]|nr:ABC-2 family transporter protein [Candidatus Gracilibacteria bacterium]